MPNWCYNQVAIYACSEEGERELRKLYMRIAGIGTEVHNVPEENMMYEYEGAAKKVESDWYGMLLLAHGKKAQDVECRGDIQDRIEWGEHPQNHIYFRTETAWGPQIEVIQEMLENYEDLAFEYTAEECGCEIYINTDTVGVFFPDRYYIEWDLCGCGGDSDYVSNVAGLAVTVSEIIEDVQEKYPDFKPKYMDKFKDEGSKSITEDDIYKVRDEIEEFLTEKDEGEYEYFGIHKFEES